MNSYIVSCCSTADLFREHFEKRDIHFICFHYTLDGKDYPDDLGQTQSIEDFYQSLISGADSKTSQINAEEFVAYFEPFLMQGHDVIHLTLSSGISGVLNSANAAAEILRSRYPERKLYIVDSLAASSGYGLLMDAVADKRDEGMSIDELRDWVEENKLYLHHWFFSGDLKFFIKGGRISRTAGAIGTVLGICPLMNVDYQGKLVPREKVRPKRKCMMRMVEKMVSHARDGLDYSGKVYMSQSYCMDDAKAVADMIESKFTKMNGKVLINHIGTVIGSHTGPGTVALFFWGDKRED